MAGPNCVLGFNEVANSFYFKSDNPNSGKIYGARKAVIGSGFGWVFSGGYPDGYIALKDFKQIFPAAEATDAAIKKITYLKSVPDQLVDFTAIEKSGHKFVWEPYHHQKFALEHMLHYPRLAIAYDPGLGKTFIASNYLAIQHSKRDFPTVIFAPLIVHPNWEDELNTLTDLRTLVYAGTAKEKDALRERINTEPWDVIITNYDGMTPALEPSVDLLWDYWEGLCTQARENLVGNWVRAHFYPNADLVLRNDMTKMDYKAAVLKMLKKIPADVLKTTTLTEMMHNDRDDIFLAKHKFRCIILDEAHRVKGHNSKRSIAMQTLASKIEYRYLLSGTLSLGSPLDVFMPFNIMHPLILGENFWNHKKEYTVPHKYNKHAIDGYKNLDRLKAKIDPYMICMTKAECLDLPPVISSRRYYTMTDEQIDLYNQIVKEETITIDGQVIDVSLPVVKLGKLLQVMSGFLYMPLPRNDELCGNCENILECVETDCYPWNPTCTKYDVENPIKRPKREIKQFSAAKIDLLRGDLEDLRGKVIIWAFYQEDLVRIEALLKSMRIKYITPATPKCDKIYEASPDIQVFLGQVSQGIGITLNSAKTMIYYSHSIKLEDLLQSIDRNLRIGQTESVEQRFYLCPKTVEEAVVRLLAAKQDVRDFLQAKVECMKCPNSMFCFERDIRPFTEQCIHYERRLEVEDRKGIKLRVLKQPEAYEYPNESDNTGSV